MREQNMRPQSQALTWGPEVLVWGKVLASGGL